MRPRKSALRRWLFASSAQKRRIAHFDVSGENAKPQSKLEEV
jgi:hypothetical protein